MITSLYAALLGLMLVFLSINVIRERRRIGAGIGDANDMKMARCIRAQANFTEYTPLFLILLGCAEYNALSLSILHFFGIIFVAGRCMHAYSLLGAEKYSNNKLLSYPVWRIRGMTCTFSAFVLLSSIILIKTVTCFTSALWKIQ